MSKLGKRYECPNCGTVILCTKASPSNPVCCDKEMPEQKAKKKPSSD
ncbi:MAG: desulforedoxin [Deltaproteobacteria bacterium]|nr:desulforedoxin [Deltaproteobacteria bacterium]